MTDTAIEAAWLTRASDSSSPSAASPSAVSSNAVSSNAVSLGAAFLETMGELIDDVVEADRDIARAYARRAAVIDQARAWSETTASLMTGDSSLVRRWTDAAVARRSLVSELAAALRLPERSTENLIEESRSLLRELPATFDALTEGDISHRHAQVIVDQSNSLPETARRPFERAALPFAAKLTVSRFDRKARVLRERSHPESIELRHAARRSERELTLQPGVDGMSWLTAHLPATTAEAIYNRVTDVAALQQSPSEQRTLTQLRADVFSELLIDGVTPADHPRQPDLGRGIRARVLITVPVLTLLDRSVEHHGTDGRVDDAPTAGPSTAGPTAAGPSTAGPTAAGPTAAAPTTPGHIRESAVLEGYGPIDLDTAKQLAANAPGFVRILTHPETGAVLSLGRDRYAIPPDLRAWLRMRDETCRAPGCGTAARRCDIDHTMACGEGGPSNYDNLAHLCPKHHDQKHHTQWSVQHADGGALEWTSPTGHRYTTEPATAMPAGP